MHFPLPRYHASGPDPLPAGAPKDLHILLDGQPVRFKTTVRAFDKGKDVTARLHRLGLSDRQIAGFPGQAPFNEPEIQPITPKQSRELVKAGLAEITEACGEDTCLSWEADVSYDWQVALPKDGHLHAVVSYVPMASVNVDTDYLNRDRLINDYCAAARKVSDWTGRDGQGPVHGSAVTLNLPVRSEPSAFDVSGVEHFILRIRKDAPDELVNYCFPGERKQVSSLTEQTDLYDYTAMRLCGSFSEIIRHPLMTISTKCREFPENVRARLSPKAKTAKKIELLNRVRGSTKPKLVRQRFKVLRKSPIRDKQRYTTACFSTAIQARPASFVA